MHNHHLICTSKMTVFCLLFSFFQRCIFLRLLFCKGLLVYCLEDEVFTFCYNSDQYFQDFYIILHEGIKRLPFAHFYFHLLINKTFSRYLQGYLLHWGEENKKRKTFSRNFWNWCMWSFCFSSVFSVHFN